MESVKYTGSLTLADGLISCPETSVTNYQRKSSKIPEIRRSRNKSVHCKNRTERIQTPCLQNAQCRILTTEHGSTYHKTLRLKDQEILA
jgi:hypothetical protein